MAFEKILIFRKDLAFSKLSEDGWTRFFVEDIDNTNPTLRNYLHVKVLRKDKANNFIVEEIPIKDRKLKEEQSLLTLENGFASKDIVRKLNVNAEVIIRGFKIESKNGEVKQIFVDDRNRQNKAVIWCLRDHASNKAVTAVSNNNAVVTVATASGNNTVAAVTIANANEIYNYSKLNELSACDRVYLYGVVKSLKYLPDKGASSTVLRRLDLMLTDDSIGFDEGIEFKISSEKPEDLENINLFDIVRFHRITVEPAYGKLNTFKGFGEVGFRGFHFLIFNSVVGSDMKPRSTSLSNTLTDTDIERVRQLRNWSADFFPKENDGPDLCPPLSRFITKGAYQDLTMQVIAVGIASGSFAPTVIRGWDGTKIGIEGMNKLHNFRNEAKEVVIDDELNNIVDNLSLSVDVFIYDELKDPASKVKPGDFIKLGNVHAVRGKVRPSLVLHGGMFSQMGKQHGRGFWLLNAKSRAAIQLKSKLTKLLPEQQLGTSICSTRSAAHASQTQPNALASANFDDSFDKLLLSVGDFANCATKAESSSSVAKKPCVSNNLLQHSSLTTNGQSSSSNVEVAPVNSDVSDIDSDVEFVQYCSPRTNGQSTSENIQRATDEDSNNNDIDSDADIYSQEDPIKVHRSTCEVSTVNSSAQTVKIKK